MIRDMRLWDNRQASAIWIGGSYLKAQIWIAGIDWNRGRCWVEDEKKPAIKETHDAN